MIAPAINHENAKELQQRSVIARRENKELRRLAKLAEQVAPAKPAIDPYVEELMRAQVETLAELRACPMAKDKASLAQALKNLRETYHLATGLAKPGVLKPASQRPRQQSRDLPDAPDGQS